VNLIRLLFVAILYFYCFSVSAQKITEEKTTEWHHFQKNEFKIDGIQAWYVEPKSPISGNPWVWRAHFPTWHTTMDSILLERGFHIAYINTNNLYGHSSAMMIWDKFYSYLVNEKSFASKVALEGVSRGGLYVYNWAKRNPSKVNCIYAEAPVCDFKSWPGGKGKGKGSENDWKSLFDVYGFQNEEEVLQYRDQPKDNLDALAAFKVPILHVIGLNDSIVPPEENTFVLVNNYIQKGGTATVVPITKGKQELNGHHFDIENPELLADFIYKNSVPVVSPLKSQDFIYPFGNLNNTLYPIQHERKATVAFLGGSITNMKGWRDKVSNYLMDLFPETEFTFINAGIPSLGSLPHAFRLQTDVLDKGPIDLMFIESAVNDQVNGTTEQHQRRALEGIIRHAYIANPTINMVMMAFADEDKVDDYQIGKLPLEVNVHQDLANYYKIPFINLAEEVTKRIVAGEFTWNDDFKDLHPSSFGQEIYFATIKALLQKEFVNQIASKPVSVNLPVPLQKFSYTNGAYLSVNKASIKNGFTINPFWKPNDGVRARSGFVNVPVLTAEIPDANFELSFEGTAVGIAVLAGPDAGIINYSIDGKEYQSIDLFTEWSSGLHLPWYVMLDDNLSKGKHTLKLNVASSHNKQSKGTACRIVHFLINK